MKKLVFKIICFVFLITAYGSAKSMNDSCKVYADMLTSYLEALVKHKMLDKIDWNYIKEYIEKGKLDVNQYGFMNLFLLACYSNNLDAVKWFLSLSSKKTKKETVNTLKCKNAPRWFLSPRPKEMVNAFTRTDSDYDGDCTKYCPLCWAILAKNLDMIKLLLPECDWKTIWHSWLCFEVAAGLMDEVNELFKKGIANDISILSHVLSGACEIGKLDIVKSVLSLYPKEDVVRIINVNNCVIFDACKHGGCEMAKVLLPFNQKETLSSCLLLDPDHWEFLIVKLLVENGAAIDKIMEIKNLNVGIERYLQAVAKYDKHVTLCDKVNFVLGTKKRETWLFESLVRVAFERAVYMAEKSGIEAITKTPFYELYQNSQIDCKKIFGIKREEDIKKFMEKVTQGGSFRYTDLFGKKNIFKDKLVDKIKNKKLIDVVVICQQ